LRNRISRRQLEATAYHEAGHAVAAIEMGFKVSSVSIQPDEFSHGRTVHNNPLYRMNLNSHDHSDRLRLRVERAVIIALAGPEAQQRFNPRSIHKHDVKDDVDRVMRVLSEFTASNEELKAYFDLLRIRARQLIALRWDAVRRLSRALCERTALSGAETRRIITADD